MLIGLMSDTHEHMDRIRAAVRSFNENNVALVLHAGDIVSPICAQELNKLSARLVAVFGNNDGEKKAWRERIAGWGEVHDRYYDAQIDGQRLLLMHEPYTLEPLAKSQDFDVIVYGHTHKFDERRVGKTLVVNPGECGGWLTGKATIALLELPEKKVRVIELN